MKSLFAFVFMFCVIFVGIADEKENVVYNSKNYAFVRIFADARKSARWRNAKTLSDRMMAVYHSAMKFSTVSDPVSDRYMITCYGGPIDLVHFFGVASHVASGMELEDALYKQWEAEGGPDNRYRFNWKSPPEADPDDLPSNAFGALFASEIIEKHDNNNPDFKLQEVFEKFITPLIVVPDSIAKQFSHREYRKIQQGNKRKRPMVTILQSR